MSDWYGLTAFSTHHTVDELIASDSYAGKEPVSIGDRSGILQHQAGLDASEECVVALRAQQGMVEISVGLTDITSGKPHDLCATAKDLTTAFLPYLPK